MNSKNLIRRNDTILPSSYLWVAAALSVILILGTFLSAPRVGASEDPIQRGIDADAARYQALGASYLARAEAGRLRGLDAASARWAALSTSYAQGSAEQPYTDVSLFYVEKESVERMMIGTCLKVKDGLLMIWTVQESTHQTEPV